MAPQQRLDGSEAVAGGIAGHLSLVDAHHRDTELGCDFRSFVTDDERGGEVHHVGGEGHEGVAQVSLRRRDDAHHVIPGKADARDRHDAETVRLGGGFVAIGGGNDEGFVALLAKMLEDPQDGVGHSVYLRQERFRDNRYPHVIDATPESYEPPPRQGNSR